MHDGLHNSEDRRAQAELLLVGKQDRQDVIRVGERGVDAQSRGLAERAVAGLVALEHAAVELFRRSASRISIDGCRSPHNGEWLRLLRSHRVGSVTTGSGEVERRSRTSLPFCSAGRSAACHPEPARGLWGFQSSATDPDLGFYAARSYSQMRPPGTARRWMRFRDSAKRAHCCPRFLRLAGWHDVAWGGYCENRYVTSSKESTAKA
jgi:hypothetical protein